ncbi:MAG: CPBP family intramembrane metalloprotease [Proteobacteria bacterium]|nr:CPBP family intramembrane metalloprotease [Pseudomonadota bacterium]
MHFGLAANQLWPDVVLALLAFVVMPAFSVVNGSRLARNPQGSLVPRYVQAMTRGWIAVGALMFVWLWAHRPLAQLGLDIPVGAKGLYGLGFDALVILVVASQLFRLPKLVGEKLPKLREQMKEIKITPRSRREFIVFFFVAITAGVWEELLYRGFLLWFLTPYVGLIGAVVLSSLIFGIGHIYQGWRGVPRTAAIGLIFAIAFAWSASLWWVMLAHAILDIYGGIVSYMVAVADRRIAAQAA